MSIRTFDMRQAYVSTNVFYERVFRAYHLPPFLPPKPSTMSIRTTSNLIRNYAQALSSSSLPPHSISSIPHYLPTYLPSPHPGPQNTSSLRPSLPANYLKSYTSYLTPSSHHRPHSAQPSPILTPFHQTKNQPATYLITQPTTTCQSHRTRPMISPRR